MNKKIWKIIIGIALVAVAAIVLLLVFSDNIQKNDKSGEEITLDGRIIQTMEDGYRIDASKSTGESTYDNVLILIDNNEFGEDDYISVSGTYLGTTTYQSAIGLDITAHVVEAEQVTASSYMEANAPTLKTVELDDTKTQLGYSVTLQKIEFAENETRVYVRVGNAGSSEFSVYDFNTKVTQGSTQYEVESSWEADYPKVQSELLPGNETEGIMTFTKLEESNLTVLIQGRSDNWEENLEDFTFEVEL